MTTTIPTIDQLPRLAGYKPEIAPDDAETRRAWAQRDVEMSYKETNEALTELALPDLIGSPKQVEWALSLRRDWIRQRAGEILSKIRRAPAAAEQYNAYAAKLWAGIDETLAGAWIDRCKPTNY